jgi:hypothetical protein
MITCENCNRVFRDIYNLTRHQSKKVQCIKSFCKDPGEQGPSIVPNSTLEKQNNILEKQFNILEKQFNTLEKQNNISENCISTIEEEMSENQCEYCLHKFFNISSKNRHYNSCKGQDDQVRQLENDLNIKPKIPQCSTECRFCNKVLSRTDTLNKHYKICKEREEYRKQLKEQVHNKKFAIQTVPVCNTVNNNINNGTINNNTINNNNININIFGKEDLSHITAQRIIDEIRRINKSIDSSDDTLRAGKWVIQFNCMVNEKNENKNTILQDPKSMITETFTERGWQKQYTDDVVDEAFRVRSGQLVQMKEQIEDHNPKVFKAKTNQRSWNHLEEFENKGLSQANGSRRIRSAFKVSMIT